MLIVGFFTYGTLVERIFGIDANRATPATTHTDGVDYVPMASWRIFLVQFLNIAGLGPIFGAIMGIFYGPSAFLWIVFGTIFAGGVHDYLSGMMSIRKAGASLPGIVGDELGSRMRAFINILSIVLLVLLTTTFLSGPATLLDNLIDLHDITTQGRTIPIQWVLIIFAYYTLATVMPVDKIIGKLYPLFGGILLFMGLGIMAIMLLHYSHEMPELTDGLQNRHTNGYPLFPMLFVSIACGAISGFHGTQSPIMARCVTSERQGRWIFYGAMVAEGMLALVWAAAAGTFFSNPDSGLDGIAGLQAYAAANPGKNIAALVIDTISRNWLGTIGGILAIVGVIAAPITSGDTALRSARLIIADGFHMDQRPILNRFKIALPLFLCVFGFVFIDFNIVWRYFAWTNQTLAVFTLWAGTIYLYKNGRTADKSSENLSKIYAQSYWIALVPAVFMTVVSVSYFMIAPECLNIQPEYRWIGYLVAGFAAIVCLMLFIRFTRKYKPNKL